MLLKKHFLFILFTLLSCGSVFAQDLIVTKTGENIPCRIIKEDSVSLYFTTPEHPNQLEIKKADVENYYVSEKSKMALQRKNEKDEEIFLLNVYAGIASPTSDFASRDAGDIKSGLAMQGYLFRAAGIYKLFDHVGVSASYQYQYHQMNDKSIVDQLESQLPGSSFTSKSGTWIIKGLYVGAYFNFPLKNQPGLSVFGDLNIGVPQYTLPQTEITQTVYKNNPTSPQITVTQHASYTKSTTFTGGLGINYKLNPYLGVHLSANYLQGTAYFYNILYTTSYGLTDYQNYEQKVTSVNLEAGLSFIFYHKVRTVAE